LFFFLAIENKNNKKKGGKVETTENINNKTLLNVMHRNKKNKLFKENEAKFVIENINM